MGLSSNSLFVLRMTDHLHFDCPLPQRRLERRVGFEGDRSSQ